MEAKDLDVIIFGATGYTGKYVIRELLKFTDSPPGSSSTSGPRRVGIAGRNKTKLTASLVWALEGKPSAVPVAIVEANVENPASIAAMVKRTRLVLDLVGPFRKYGEPVVKACVDAGVDYLDVTGEPEFMERMDATYHEAAVRSGSLVVCACGYDSVPAEMGVIHNARQFKDPAVPQTCDSYLVTKNNIGRYHGNIGTWESIILGAAHAGELQKLRKSRPRRSRAQFPGLLQKSRGLVHYEKNSGTWAAKLPSADAIVVRRTIAAMIDNPKGLETEEDESNAEFAQAKEQKWASIKPMNFGVYASFKNLFEVIGYFFLGVILIVLCQFKWGRSLLMKHPEIFSLGVFLKEGPTEEGVKNSFFQQWFIGTGFRDSSRTITKDMKPDMEVVTRISGPEIGYITTPICLVQAALLVLDERKKLPKGGVLTPGTVFGITNLEERLQSNGISFDVISTKTI